MKTVDPEKVEQCRRSMNSEREFDDMSMIFTMFADSTRKEQGDYKFKYENALLQKYDMDPLYSGKEE